MAQTRRASTPDDGNADSKSPRVLKKYPNRRLYDTQTSSYITLADVKKMVLDGQDFIVRDAKTSDDLTRSILLQIILEEESEGVPMFSSQMLAQIIRFYGHAMQGMMGSYLEKNLQTFTDIQKRLAEERPSQLEKRGAFRETHRCLTIPVLSLRFCRRFRLRVTANWSGRSLSRASPLSGSNARSSSR